MKHLGVSKNKHFGGEENFLPDNKKILTSPLDPLYMVISSSTPGLDRLLFFALK